jgi:hypothetical protein
VDALISDALQQRRNAKQAAANETSAQLFPGKLICMLSLLEGWPSGLRQRS